MKEKKVVLQRDWSDKIALCCQFQRPLCCSSGQLKGNWIEEVEEYVAILIANKQRGRHVEVWSVRMWKVSEGRISFQNRPKYFCNGSICFRWNDSVLGYEWFRFVDLRCWMFVWNCFSCQNINSTIFRIKYRLWGGEFGIKDEWKSPQRRIS